MRIAIEDAIMIEPLLESVICKSGKKYMYDEAQNAFIEISRWNNLGVINCNTANEHFGQYALLG